MSTETVCSILPPSKSGKIKVHPVRRFVQKVEHQKDHRRANQHLYQAHEARSVRPGVQESRATAAAKPFALLAGVSQICWNNAQYRSLRRSDSFR